MTTLPGGELKAGVGRRAVTRAPGWLAYVELAKPRLTSLVLVTTALGFLLASGSPGGALPIDWARLLAAVLGTALVGGGANGVNQWWETARDARMRRTRDRPFPSGRLRARRGLLFCALLTLAGLVLLATRTNGATAALAALSWVVYVFAYTPLKPRTTLNTLVGAVSGAIPPLMGWTAATGSPGAGGWVLFAILFVWQIPHFLAIAWLHRADYAAGGFRMLPVVDPAGRATFRIVIVYCAGLVPVSAAAALVGLAGWIYLVGAVVLGTGLLALGVRLQRRRTAEAARQLFLASLVYLPALFLLMALDPTGLAPAPF
jgi:protoheme IX farnesyltransferase